MELLSSLWQYLNASGQATTVLTLTAVFFIVTTLFSTSMRTYLLVGSLSAVKTGIELAMKGVAYGAVYLAKGLWITLKIIVVFVYDSVQRIRRDIRREQDEFTSRR